MGRLVIDYLLICLSSKKLWFCWGSWLHVQAHAFMQTATLWYFFCLTKVILGCLVFKFSMSLACEFCCTGYPN